MYTIEQQIEAVLKTRLTNQSLIEMYYYIGTIIKKFSSKQIKELELFLKNKYGVMIAFTERNLLNMIEFSKLEESLLPKLKQITWKNILVILKEKDNQLIDICLDYKPTKQELIRYIKNKKIIKNHNIELDDTLEELLKLQEVR